MAPVVVHARSGARGSGSRGRQVLLSHAVHTACAYRACRKRVVVRGGPQSNHRSWADFYLDVVATDGNAQMLSRMAVAYVFLMFMVAVRIIRSVILFKRGRKVDHEARPQAVRRRPVRRPASVMVARSCGGPRSPGVCGEGRPQGGRPLERCLLPGSRPCASRCQKRKLDPIPICGVPPGGRSSIACWSGGWRPAPWTA